MVLQLWIGDVHDTGNWYDIADGVDIQALRERYEALGKSSPVDIDVPSLRGGWTLPIVPQRSMEVMFLDANLSDPLLNKYIYSGKVLNTFISDGEVAGAINYHVELGEFVEDLYAPVEETDFAFADFPTDSSVAQEIIDNRADLQGSWDATRIYGGTSLMGWPSLQGGSGYIEFDEDSNAADILDTLASYPGADGSAAPRYWWITGEWQNPQNPPGGANAIMRVLHFGPTEGVGAALVPLTDDEEALADWVKDDFGRPTASSLGSADTGQVWQEWVGDWGIDGSGRAYLQATGAGNANVAVVSSSRSDCSVFVTVPVMGQETQLIVRAKSLGSGLWSGFGLRAGATGYALRRRNNDQTTTQLWAGGPVPANGDALKLTLSGSTIQVYVNGIQLSTVTDSFNQTEQWHGIAQLLGATTVRYDGFRVQAVGAQYHSGWQYQALGSELVTAVRIKGPGADPALVEWTGSVRAQAQAGTLRKNVSIDAWAPATAVAAGDRVRPRAPSNAHFRAQNPGTTHATIEPSWPATEGATVNDNGIIWVRETWDAGAVSTQVITEDGGEAITQIEETVLATDTFDRQNSGTQLGSADTGQSWDVHAPSGQSATYRILNGQAYCASGGANSSAVMDLGTGQCVVQAQFATRVLGSTRLVFRATDIDNMLFVRADSDGFYRLYRKQAGATTQIGASATVAVNGDYVKVSCEGPSIKVYINGAGPIISATDAFNMGATRHGLGVGSADGSRFDNWRAWQTYAGRALFLAFDAAPGNLASGDYGIVFNSDRTARCMESGVSVGPGFVYAKGEAYKVFVKRYVRSGTPRHEVRYFKQAAGSNKWSLIYLSASYPVVSAATPLRVMGLLHDEGAILSGVVVQRFTGGKYFDTRAGADGRTQVQRYGYVWADGVIHDDKLDTEDKRRSHAQQFFGQHGLRLTAKVPTRQEYVAGQRVNFTFGPGNVFSQLWPVTSVEPDRDAGTNPAQPDYLVTLGAPEVEPGDEGSTPLLGGALAAKPPKPVGLQATTGEAQDEFTARKAVVWEEGTQGQARIEFQLFRVNGGQVISQPGLPSAPYDPPTAWLEGLAYQSTYRVKARSRGYNNVPSDWTELIEFDTPPAPALAPTSGAQITNGSGVGEYAEGTDETVLNVTHNGSGDRRTTGYIARWTEGTQMKEKAIGLLLAFSLLVAPGTSISGLTVHAVGTNLESVAAPAVATFTSAPRTAPNAPTGATKTGSGTFNPDKNRTELPVSHSGSSSPNVSSYIWRWTENSTARNFAVGLQLSSTISVQPGASIANLRVFALRGGMESAGSTVIATFTATPPPTPNPPTVGAGQELQLLSNTFNTATGAGLLFFALAPAAVTQYTQSTTIEVTSDGVIKTYSIPWYGGNIGAAVAPGKAFSVVAYRINRWGVPSVASTAITGTAASAPTPATPTVTCANTAGTFNTEVGETQVAIAVAAPPTNQYVISHQVRVTSNGITKTYVLGPSGGTVIASVTPGLAWTAYAVATNYWGVTSTNTATQVSGTAASAPTPTAPTTSIAAGYTSAGIYNPDRRETQVGIAVAAPAATQYVSTHQLRVTSNGVTKNYAIGPSGGTVIASLKPGLPWTAYAVAYNRWGVVSTNSATQVSGTATDSPTSDGIYNGGFEILDPANNTKPDGWALTTANGGSYAVAEGTAYSGKRSLALTRTATSGSSAQAESGFFPAVAGKTHIFEIASKYSTLAGAGEVQWSWYDSAGTVLLTSPWAELALLESATSWNAGYVALGSLPANTAQGKIRIRPLSTAASAFTMWVDYVKFYTQVETDAIKDAAVTSAKLATTGVASGTYISPASLVVGADGRITSISSTPPASFPGSPTDGQWFLHATHGWAQYKSGQGWLGPHKEANITMLLMPTYTNALANLTEIARVRTPAVAVRLQQWDVEFASGAGTFDASNRWVLQMWRDTAGQAGNITSFDTNTLGLAANSRVGGSNALSAEVLGSVKSLAIAFTKAGTPGSLTQVNMRLVWREVLT